DVDPIYLPRGFVLCASSRSPDLGRGHTRRSTTLWVLQPNGRTRYPMSGNRNNDRWPWHMLSGYLTFSSWSRNTEVISEDKRDIVVHEPGQPSTTLPTDHWHAMMVNPEGIRPGHLLKLQVPVWRPRPLFNGRIAFITRRTDAAPAEHGRATAEGLQVAQAEAGLVTLVG